MNLNQIILCMSDFSLILKDFVIHIFPKLRSELEFHRRLAKGGIKPGGTPFINKRTGKPYLATTQLTHVLVGLTALVRFLNYLDQNSLLSSGAKVTESDFRRVCALFALHDLHKDDYLAREVKQKETSIQPVLMLEIANQVSLTEWLNNDDLNGYEYREAMIHLSDTTHGDRKYCRAEINYEKLYSLVRLVDAMASIQTLEEGTNSLKNRIKDFARSLKNIHFYYHKIDDYRGLSTNLYHQSVAKTLQEKYNFYPLIFFENGTIYIGEKDTQSFDKDSFISSVYNEFNESLSQLGKVSNDELQYNATYQIFEKYIFAFSGIKQQLEYLKNNVIPRGKSRTKTDWFEDFLKKRFSENKKFITTFKDKENFLEIFKITDDQNNREDFAEKWKAVSSYLGGLLNLLRDVYLAPDNTWQKTIEFMGNFLDIPRDIISNIFDNVSTLKQWGPPEFSHLLAYHYLHSFKHQNQSASTVPLLEILEHLNQQLLSKLETDIGEADNQEKRKNYVEDELAFSFDTHQFLSKNLVLSWEEKQEIEADSLTVITAKNKTGSPAKLCSLCNRVITSKMKSSPIKADMIEDGIKEFSNRLLPKTKHVSSRLWCPQCYLEWMIRKLSGLGYAPQAEANNSARLYFFILPNPIITPELLDVLRNELNLLRRTSVVVKQYGKHGAKSIPRIWLENKDISSEGEGRIWLEEVLNSLAEETSRQTKNHQRIPGNYLLGSNSYSDDEYLDDDDYSDDDPEINNDHHRLASNFLIFSLESSSYNEPIKKSELWMRGLLTALVLQDLLGMRVYLTDRPYLPVAYLDQITNALEIDGEHIALRSLFNAKEELSSNKLSLRGVNVDELLDRISALWVINETLNDEEKFIANCLQEINQNELAGARFFADYDRKKEFKPNSVFTLACHIILDSFEKKDNAYSMTLKNLAETIAIQSLDLFLPFSESDGKGKANRYEKTYRAAISTLKEICREPNLSNEEIIGHIAGSLIKQLERSTGTGIVFPFHKKEEEKNQLAQTFAQTIVINLFEQRCNRSFSLLSRYENKLADGVFFYTSVHLSSVWAKRKNNSQVDESS